MHATEIRVARIFNMKAVLECCPMMAGSSVTLLFRHCGEPLTLYGTAARLEVFMSMICDGLIQLMNGDHCGPINLEIRMNLQYDSLLSLSVQKLIPICL